MEELFTIIWLLLALFSAAWWGVKRPGVAFGLAMSFYVLSQWAVSGSATLLNMSGIVKMIIAGVVFILSFYHLAFGRYRIKGIVEPNYFLLLSLYGYSFLSIFWSVDVDTGLGVFLSNLPYVIVLVLIAPILVNSRSDLSSFCVSFLVFSGVTLLLMAFFREWGERGLVLPGAKSDTGNWTDFESSPLDLGTAAGLCILTGVHLLKNLSFTIRALVLILIGCLVFVMLRAGVRGQMLFCAAALGVYFFAVGRRSEVTLFLFIMAFFAFFLTDILSLLFPENQNLVERWAGEEISRGGNERLYVQTLMFNELIEAGVSGLLFGVGASTSYSVAGIYPHNIFVEALTELGIVGMLLLVSFLLKALIPCFGRSRDAKEKRVRALLMSFVAYLVLVSMKQGNIYGATLLFGFCLVVNPILLALKNEKLRVKV